MSTWRLLVACGCVTGVAVLMLFLAQEPVRFEEEYWRERIEKEGGVRAYRVFSRAAAVLPSDLAHRYAHWFTAALYDVEGLRGAEVCDTAFEYGCFHQMIAEAVTDHGEEAMHSLSRACVATEGAVPRLCAHGVGHGILSLRGYTKTGLDDALETCAREFGALGEACMSGVFMEYNAHTMQGAGTLPRPFDARTPLAPCPSIKSAYQAMCYHSLPQWWVKNLYTGVATTTLFTQLAGYCGQVDGERNRTECLRGVGALASLIHHGDAEAAISLCEASVSTHEPLRRACHEFAQARTCWANGGDEAECFRNTP